MLKRIFVNRHSINIGVRRCYSSQIQFSTEKYKHIERGSFKKLNENDINYFKTILPEPSMVLENAEDLIKYNIDWLNIFRGNSQLVLRPKTTQEVSKILKYCNENKLAVVPQGGNTGLVGGSIPLFDEIIVSTQLMNQIISFDPLSGVLVCQAGCILETLSDYVGKYQFIMPLDLGAKGTCNIGGNLSTNAGGIRFLRYGSLHGSTLGLEAVKGDGSVINCLSTVRKDNVGYHLKHLFIGSEGTLGIITKASILCPKAPSSINLALLGCGSFDNVLKILDIAKDTLGEVMSAFEFMDQDSLSCSERYLKDNCPLNKSPFYVVVETSGSVADHDQEKLNQFLEKVSSFELISDGTVASDLSKIRNLWKFRETIAVGLLMDGHCFKYDVSLPLNYFYKIVDFMEKKLSNFKTTRICGYGHVGDGNIHFNVTCPVYDAKLEEAINDALYDYVIGANGSISAEHGIGLFKRDHIEEVKSPEVMSLMRDVKNMMDPNHILNPYKIMPI